MDESVTGVRNKGVKEMRLESEKNRSVKGRKKERMERMK